MLNYSQIEFAANELRSTYLARAEQRRFAQRFAPYHPVLPRRSFAWIGARLVRWGSSRQGQATPSVALIDVDPQPAPQ